MNLPTKITVARIGLIPLMLLAYCFYDVCKYACIAVTFIFCIASCTDFVDGYLARKNNMVTDLGKFLDPIADKVLVAIGLLIIIATARASWYRIAVVVGSSIILAREFIIGAFRQIAATKGCVMAADGLGKLKTIFTMVGIGGLLLEPISYNKIKWVGITGMVLFYIGLAAFVVAVILTVWSGINYMVKNKHVLKEVEKDQKIGGKSELTVQISGDSPESAANSVAVDGGNNVAVVGKKVASESAGKEVSVGDKKDGSAGGNDV